MCAIIIAGITAIPEVNDDDMVTVQVNRIYAIIEEPPFYNLTEYWIIAYSPEQMTVKDLSNEWSFGFAYWGIDNNTSICNMFPEIEKFNACSDEWLMIGGLKGDGCWDGNCITLLWHEMKHLLCDCDWHKNMKSQIDYVQNTEGWI